MKYLFSIYFFLFSFTSLAQGSVRVEYMQTNFINGEMKTLKNTVFELVGNDNFSYFNCKKIPSNRDDLKYTILMSSNEPYYTDLKENTVLAEISINKKYLYNLKHPGKLSVTKDTITISGIKCRKAILVQKKYSEKYKKTFERIITLWYAEDIPLPFGPLGYFGLPGLILKVHIPYKGEMIAKKVFINKEDKHIPKFAPKDLEIITDEELKKISDF